MNLFELCDVDELTEEELTPVLFEEKYSLRRPFIVRNATVNALARRFLSDRCDILERFGHVPVELGSPFSLSYYGRADSSMALRKYLETPFSLSAPLYFFDRMGKWMDHLGELRSMLKAPPSLQLQPVGSDAAVIFAIGKTGSGIGLHAHQDAWNQVLFGAKRWTLYPGSPGGVPAEADFNPTEPHLQWLHDVYPNVKDQSAFKPMECVQRPGDIIYVPEGWYHATVNLGDTGAIARRTEEFTPGSSREVGERVIRAVQRKLMNKPGDDAVALAEEAQRIDPHEGDHAVNMGHAMAGAERMTEAIHAFQRATQLMPKNPGASMEYGKLLNRLGEHRDARAELLRGKELCKTGSANPLYKALEEQLAISSSQSNSQTKSKGSDPNKKTGKRRRQKDREL